MDSINARIAKELNVQMGQVAAAVNLLGEGATVHGAVQAENVRICGIVNGQIRADNVTLEKSARVTGDILHKSLSIEQGAFLEGMCKRIDSSANGAIEPRPLLPKDKPKDRVIGLGNSEPLSATDKASVN